MSESSNTNPSSLVALLLQLPVSVARVFGLITAVIITLLLGFLFKPSLTLIEENLGALGWTLAPDTTLEQRVTLVVIDEKSIAEVGPWPWRRDDMARLITSIDTAGAQLQLHDITYPESRPGDDQFIAAATNSNGIIISQTPALDQTSRATVAGMLSHPINGVFCTAASGGIQIPQANGFAASAATFSGIPKGHNATLLDSDGAVRRTPAVICDGDSAYPALPVAAFLQLGSSGQWQGNLESENSFLAPTATLTLPDYPGLQIPVDSDGSIRVSYTKSPDSFLALSAIDVMNGDIDTRMLENAWVLVGVTAFGSGDIVPTPYSGAAFGIEIQARLLTSLLDVDVPYTPASAALLLLLISGLFVAALYGLATLGDRVAAYGLPTAVIVLPITALSVHVAVLSNSSIWLGWIMPALFSVTAASALLLLELGKTRMERSRVFGNLNSYLPNDVAKEIAFSLPTSSVNAHRCDVTLLNADLRNFSAFGEARPPEEIAAVLHYFFTRATEIIESQGGRVQEFKGDSLLAIWDGADRISASNALRSAKLLHEALNETLLPEHTIAGLEPLALGIGIEQGPVLIGSIGPAHRRSHTLLGDTVSITLRIQEMTAELAQPVLIGECAARQLNDENLESQGSYLLSGLRIPHTLFAPASGTEQSRVESQPNLTVVSGGKR